MYVCLCNAFREADIRGAVSNGARSTEEVFFALGSAPNCGGCLDFADRVVEEAKLSEEAVCAAS